MIDHETASAGPHRSGKCANGTPQAHHHSTFVLRKGRQHNGEGGRRQQGSANGLKHTGRHQPAHIASQATSGRSSQKQRNACQEDSLAPVGVSQPPAGMSIVA